MNSFFQESFFYVLFAGILQTVLALVLSPFLLLIARRRGPGSLPRVVLAYIFFNSFLLFWGCFGNFGFYSLTFDKLYYSTDYVVDWFPFIPFGQWIIDREFGSNRGYLIGDTTLWQLRGIWLAFAAPVWLLSYFSMRWALRVRWPATAFLSADSRLG